MKNLAAPGCIAAILAAVSLPQTALAQHAGFQAGVVQPPFAFVTQPPSAPVVAVRSTFRLATVPVAPALPVGPSVAPVPLVPLVPLVPTFPTVIVPNVILVPGQTTFAAPIVHSGVIPFGPVSVAPSLPAQGPAHRIPPFGTPRAEVLRLLGQPSVTIITSTGETLYFTGGVTVIIQNGQVVGPR